MTGISSLLPPDHASLRKRRGDVVIPRAVWTSRNDVSMSKNISICLDDSLAERLLVRARASWRDSLDRLRRYAEEGSRRNEHPMITFGDGPTGRRAGLIGGGDVWEIAMWVDEVVTDEGHVDMVVSESALSHPQVDAALRYRATYPEEISARIELHRHESVDVHIL